MVFTFFVIFRKYSKNQRNWCINLQCKYLRRKERQKTQNGGILCGLAEEGQRMMKRINRATDDQTDKPRARPPAPGEVDPKVKTKNIIF